MLLAAPFPTRQGTQVYVRHQAEALAKAGVDLHLVTYRDGQGEYRPDYELSRAFSPLRSTRSGPSFGKPFADLSLFATAARILKKRNHDVIWAHHIEALAIGLLLKKLFSIPLVFQAHTDLAEELPLYYQQSFVKSQARRVAEIFEKSTYPRADCVVVFDRAHADKIQSLGVSKSKIETIAAALNFGHWPSPSGVQKDLRVLYAGNPDEYQNLSLFWKAAKIISKKRPDVSFEVLTHHLP
ncbi:glycosyltransferase, partial [Myxococcota bacterium]|nr:glycosyltransferase [Myxococcota bacterium]